MARHEIRGLLKVRSARRYLLAQGFGFVSDTAMWLAAGIWIADLTGHPGAAALAVFWVSLLQLAAPLSGWLADRLPRRALLVATNLVAGAAIAALLLVRDERDVWLIYAVLAVNGLAYTVLSAAGSAMLVDLVPHRLLGTANAFLSMLREGARVAAPAAGAGLYAWLGPTPVIVLDVATFLAAAAVMASLPSGERVAEPSRGWWHDLTAGTRHILGSAALMPVVATGAVFLAVLGTCEAASYALIDDALGLPPDFMGVLATAVGAGAVIGGAVSLALVTRMSPVRLAGLGMLACGVGAIGYLPGQLPVLLAGALVRGLGLPWLMIGVYTLLQQRTPRDLQGRVAGSASLLLGGPLAMGMAFGAGLVDHLGYQALLGAIAVTGLAGGIIWLPGTGPGTRGRHEHVPDEGDHRGRPSTQTRKRPHP